jgi:hypothetical protein
MASYASASDLATYMKQDVDTANAELMLAGASAAVQSYLGWDLASGTVTERVDSPGGPLLLLRTLKLNSVTSITDASGNTAASGYTWSERGMLHLDPIQLFWFGAELEHVYTGFCAGFGAYTVTYDSGYGDIPSDVVMTVCSMVYRALTVPPGTQQRISTAGGRTESARYFNIDGFSLAETEKLILDKYALPPEVS